MRGVPRRVARFVPLSLLSGAICVGAGLVSSAVAEPQDDRSSDQSADPAQPAANDEASGIASDQNRDISASEAAAGAPQPEARGEPAEAPAAVTPADQPSAEVQAASTGLKSELKIGGAVRLNYFVKSWDGEEANRKRLGDLAFDTFRFNIDGTYGPLLLSAEYRLYQGYHMMHHGYVGYALSDAVQVDVGVSQVPFGLLKYASHSWFFDITYYLGMEDDYDLGARVTIDLGDLDVGVGFYKNSEGTFTGSTLASARYSYDVVPTSTAELGYAGLTEDRYNSESNQGNLRGTYTVAHGALGSTELGVSGRVGGLYNSETARTGYHWAAAAHVNGNYGPFNVQLQGIAYRFKPKNPAGQDDSFVVMGAYDAPYMVASAGQVVSANVAYNLPVNQGPLDALTFYNDYSVLLKSDDDFYNSHQNVTGMLISAGPTYTYVDFAVGRNHPWLGPFYGSGLAAGDPDDGWHGRFNINIGYYF